MFNLLKEEIPIGEVICQKCSQTRVESDIIVPDIKPDIKKILDVSGYVCITQKQVQQDKVFVQGNVHMTVLYVPDGEAIGKIKNLTVSKEFNHTIDCRGAMPDMQLATEAEIANMDYTTVNSRKLNLRCTLNIGVKVTKASNMLFSTDVEENENIALKKDRLRIISGTDTSECKIILREQLELPSGKPTIGEILKITAIPSSTELCMMENKAVAKGQVRVCVLYTADDESNSIQFMEYTIPFTEIIDAVGATEDMDGEIEYSLNDIYHEIREDSDGEARTFGIELVLNASLKGNRVTDIDSITDAYSLKLPLSLTTKSHKIEQLLENSSAEISHKDTAHLPSMMPDIARVYDVSSRASIENISVNDGKIHVYGKIITNILYLSENEETPVASFDHASDFNHTFALTGINDKTICDARTYMNHVSYTLSGDSSLDLRFVIGLSVKSLITCEVTLVENIDINENEDFSPTPCMVIYFVQNGDSLWKIAKHYRTTVENIKILNELDSDTIYPGQQIKIMAC